MSDELIRFENGISYRQSGDIVADTRVIIESSRHAAQRAVNAALAYRNWLIGRRIEEEEYRGTSRSQRYGKEIV